jgi:hypothetical protein
MAHIAFDDKLHEQKTGWAKYRLSEYQRLEPPAMPDSLRLMGLV